MSEDFKKLIQIYYKEMQKIKNAKEELKSE